MSPPSKPKTDLKVSQVSQPNSVVVGGTGFLGRYIVDSLVAAGHKVTVVSRSAKRARALLGSKIRVIEGKQQSTIIPPAF